MYRQESQRVKFNKNKKSNAGSHISDINNLDLWSNNSANDYIPLKQKAHDIFTPRELVNDASEKHKRLWDENIEGNKVQILQKN